MSLPVFLGFLPARPSAFAPTAMNIRRQLIRQTAASSIREYVIEVNPIVAKYIESKSAAGTPILPKVEGVKFYIISSGASHIADYKVMEVTSQKQRDKLIGKARVFC